MFYSKIENLNICRNLVFVGSLPADNREMMMAMISFPQRPPASAGQLWNSLDSIKDTLHLVLVLMAPVFDTSQNNSCRSAWDLYFHGSPAACSLDDPMLQNIGIHPSNLLSLPPAPAPARASSPCLDQCCLSSSC